MNITLLFGIFPPNKYNFFVENSKGNTQYAADALQKSIIHGFSYTDMNVSIINLPYIGSYPKRYSILKIHSFPFEFDINGKTIQGWNVGFLNLLGYKFLSRYFHARKALLRHHVKNEDDVIIIYAIGTPFLKAVADLKKKYPRTKVILIVPDLPEFMSSKKGAVRNLIEKINIRVLNRLYKFVDGYVLLSKHMTERLPINNKPWVVVEGIYNPKDFVKENNAVKNENYILYTGTLAYRYGVMNLVKAFCNIPNKDIQLIICGDGDAKDEIIKFSQKDTRIVFKGLVKRAEALKLQQEAMLLVNPRTPEGEFTKFSFPSKTMEYLGSGVPTLLYRLPGIPKEYYDYCISLSDISQDALTNKLIEIVEMDRDELSTLGSSARQFILENKNPREQVRKILDLIDRL